MVRTLHRLSPAKVRNAGVGMHADGGNLYLQVTQGVSGLTRSWVLRYSVPGSGRTRWMGLGPLITISLADARAAALEARKLIIAGTDPLEAKRARRASAALAGAKAVTFDQAAAAYIAEHETGWRNARHREQWVQSLADYASPVLGKIAVKDIDTELVLKVLRPIWTKRPETGRRVRARIEAIINFAVVDGDRANPARWKGHLEFKLDKRARKVAGTKPLAALPHTEIGAFMSELRQQDGIAARALEFTILTATRTSEVRGAKWDEIDLNAKTWTIPGARMKAGKEHRVALSPAAITVLAGMAGPGDRIFPVAKGTMLLLLGRMGRRVTTHGFRSTFRTWAAEQTSFPSAVVEMSLAHTVGSEVERAYQRSDLIDHRRRLMDQWATYCSRPPTAGSVTPMRRA
jgi:integrase